MTDQKHRHYAPLTEYELNEIRNVVADRYAYSVSERFRLNDALHDIKRLIATIDHMQRKGASDTP
jgi:hypothetical protein